MLSFKSFCAEATTGFKIQIQLPNGRWLTFKSIPKGQVINILKVMKQVKGSNVNRRVRAVTGDNEQLLDMLF
jgi:hypothetical protein